METSNWTKIKSAAELLAHWNDVAKLDRSFAATSKAWYETRTLPQLCTLRAGAWDSNQSEQYMLARSYGALLTGNGSAF